MPPRVYDWHDDPTGTFLAPPDPGPLHPLRAGRGLPQLPHPRGRRPLGAWETWVVLEAVAFDFDGAEVIVRRGRPSRPPAREAPRPLRLGRAGPGLPLRHPPHPAHPHPLRRRDAAPRPRRGRRPHLDGPAPAGAGAVRPRLRRLGGGPRPAGRRAVRPARRAGHRDPLRPPGAPLLQRRPLRRGRAQRDPFPASPRGRILLAIGDAAETTDTLYPWMRLMEAGYECVVAAPEVRAYRWCCTSARRAGTSPASRRATCSRPTSPSRTSSRRSTTGSSSPAGGPRVHPLRPGPQRRRALDAGPRSPGGLGLPRDRGPGHGGRDPGQARHLRPQVPVRRRGGRRHLRRGPGGGGRPPGHRRARATAGCGCASTCACWSRSSGPRRGRGQGRRGCRRSHPRGPSERAPAQRRRPPLPGRSRRAAPAGGDHPAPTPPTWGAR